MRLWTAARVPAARLKRHPTTVAGDRPLLHRGPDGRRSIWSNAASARRRAGSVGTCRKTMASRPCSPRRSRRRPRSERRSGRPAHRPSKVSSPSSDRQAIRPSRGCSRPGPRRRRSLASPPRSRAASPRQAATDLRRLPRDHPRRGGQAARGGAARHEADDLQARKLFYGSAGWDAHLIPGAAGVQPLYTFEEEETGRRESEGPGPNVLEAVDSAAPDRRAGGPRPPADIQEVRMPNGASSTSATSSPGSTPSTTRATVGPTTCTRWRATSTPSPGPATSAASWPSASSSR